MNAETQPAPAALRVGSRVRLLQLADEDEGCGGGERYLGRTGTVTDVLGAAAGCGETPSDPLFIVRLDLPARFPERSLGAGVHVRDGFWREELMEWV